MRKCGLFILNARGEAVGIEIKESVFSSRFSVLNHC